MPTTLSDVDAEALGQRWLAAGGGWRRGMRGVDGRLCAWDGYETEATVPDLRDAATRGAALEVVRERWGDPTMHMASLRLGWVWAFRDEAEVNMIIADGLPIAGTTEAEALVAALEARQ